MRRGFSTVELLITVAIIAIVAGVTVPLYRHYQIRNDLELAVEQAIQALGRAQLLSQIAQEGSEWGFQVPTGTLFRGRTYATRNANYDEVYAPPSTITASGLPEVSFSLLDGMPSASGTIVLENILGDRRTIVIRGGSAGGFTVGEDDDRLTICHRYGNPNCHTISIPEAAWSAHRGHGDILGECDDDDGDGDDCDLDD